MNEFQPVKGSTVTGRICTGTGPTVHVRPVDEPCHTDGIKVDVLVALGKERVHMYISNGGYQQWGADTKVLGKTVTLAEAIAKAVEEWAVDNNQGRND